MEKPSPPTPAWIDLPRDITGNILHRLGAVEILETAQKVCTTWRSVCKDPAMWRVIDMHIDGDLSYTHYDDSDMEDDLDKHDLVEMCRHAVDRSQGQLVQINLERFPSDELLDYIAARSGNLRELRLFRCYDLSDGCLTAAIKRFPNLEALNVSVTTLSNETIEMVGRCCPLLRFFELNKEYSGFSSTDEEALAIARSMPELRHLRLLRNGLTNEGIEAIINGCPHLETLYLRGCYSVRIMGDLEKRLSAQIKCFKYIKYSSSDDEPDMDFPISSRDGDFDFNSD